MGRRFLLLVLLLVTNVELCSVSGINMGIGLLERGDAGVAPLWTNFETELNVIGGSTGTFSAVMPEEREGYSRAESTFVQTLAVELEELRETLTEAGVPEERRNGIIEAHRRERELLKENQQRSTDAAAARAVEGLPGEMGEYFRGLIQFHSGAVEEAREVWRKLLAWPESRRQYRTVWATYMLGRSWGDEPEALEYYRLVRELAEAGWRDSLGLAAASLGWEARVHWKQGNYREAFRLYLQQWRAGDPTALASLRQVVPDVLRQDDEVMESLVADEVARKIVTAYLSSARSVYYMPEYDSDRVLAWLAAADAAAAWDATEAERLALIAYQLGVFHLAEQWRLRARPESPAMRWLEAKLLLRAGEVARAQESLKDLADRFPVGIGSDAVFGEVTFVKVSIRGYRNLLVGFPVGIRSDLAVAYFAEEDYVKALDAFLESSRWLDAAYVAERVLPVDVLRDYVETHWPEERTEVWQTVSGEQRYLRYGFIGTLRPLLGRRLARERRFQEAWIYLPEAVREDVEALSAHLRMGTDVARPTEERAAALWEAAQIVRRSGMEIFGTELGPDWHVYEGGFIGNMTPENRATEGVAAVSARELEAVALTGAVPDRRFHYRYLAADLAWEAAEVMPDNSEETAKVLHTAGSWLKDRDPEAADRFYKALVLRCGETPLGREADRLRWFPVKL